MKISKVIEEVVDWAGLARWLCINPNNIITHCNIIESNVLTSCYRRKLVEIYRDRTAKSPQQVAENMARVLEDEMENKEVASELRELSFGEL